MKKRAVVATMASLALAGVMCVGFAACGGESAKSIKGEEVTAEQWDAAFENEELYQNFKLEIENETVITMGDIKVTIDATGELLYADQKTYTTQKAKTSVKGDLPAGAGYSDGTVESEYYVDETGETTKYIEKKDGAWAYVEQGSGMDHYTSAMEELEFLIDQAGSLDFEDYEYSTEHNGYVEKDAEEGDLIVIKFKDGKLKAMYVEQSGTEGPASMSMTGSYVITYGGQSVTLPTVA